MRRFAGSAVLWGDAQENARWAAHRPDPAEGPRRASKQRRRGPGSWLPGMKTQSPLNCLVAVSIFRKVASATVLLSKASPQTRIAAARRSCASCAIALTVSMRWRRRNAPGSPGTFPNCLPSCQSAVWMMATLKMQSSHGSAVSQFRAGASNDLRDFDVSITLVAKMRQWFASTSPIRPPARLCAPPTW